MSISIATKQIYEVLNKIGENIFIIDTNLNILFANQHVNQLLETINRFTVMNRKEGLVGRHISSLDPQLSVELQTIINEGLFPTEFDFKLYSRLSARIVIDQYIDNDELNGYILTWKDVTEFEKELIDLKTALDESLIVAFTDRKGKIIHVNDKFCEISKYPKQELIGQNYSILRSNTHNDDFFHEIQDYVNEGHLWQGPIKDKAKDGECYWTQTILFPLEDSPLTPYQQIVIQTDITEHKKTEEKLKETLKELSDIKYAIDESSILAITDKEFRFIYVNDNFCEISKYRRDELLGQSPTILGPDRTSSEEIKRIFRAASQGKVWRGEIKKYAKDGSLYWVFLTIVPLMDDSGFPYQYISIQQDITSRKKAEAMLQRTEKLSVVGELAAGIAHEIRNPLTAIKGFTQLMEFNQLYKNIILDEIDRINFIVSEFLVLAKPHAIKFVPKLVPPMIRHMVSLLESEANLKNVRFEIDIDQESSVVLCEENQLKQVFLNLMKNSIDAMPSGGEIKVKMKESNEMVVISFKDEGIGIPPELIEKLGDPFFSTKEDGNGLGLMVSFKIIQSHGGHIQVDSQMNVGTCFMVSIPTYKMST